MEPSYHSKESGSDASDHQESVKYVLLCLAAFKLSLLMF